jgi:hypothetical protein
MEARGQVDDAGDDEGFSDAATPVLPVPMQVEGTAATAAASDVVATEVTGSEFSDPASMLEAADPLAAHMDALRRQLDGNFRDLTNHSDDPKLERYVEAEEDAGAGDRAETGGDREDPRDFYARVMAHQRAMEDEQAAGESHSPDTRDKTTAHLLSSVPPVTSEQAAMLAAQYASMDAAARSAPAPDDERFEAAPPKPDQQVWVKDAPDRTPVRADAESDDEDVALLKEMAALSIRRNPATVALNQAENDLAEAADSIARGDTMQAEHVTEDGSVVEENELSHLSSVLDGEVADIASTMLAADEILAGASDALKVATTEAETDIEDPVATLLAIAAEAAAEKEQPTNLNELGVPPISMGGGAGLGEIGLQSEEQLPVPLPSASIPTRMEALPDEMHVG